MNIEINRKYSTIQHSTIKYQRILDKVSVRSKYYTKFRLNRKNENKIKGYWVRRFSIATLVNNLRLK